MRVAAATGVSARGLREFGLALRNGPFRVALVLSLLVHLALLLVFGWGKLGREGGGERRIPLMHVRLLSPPAPAPAEMSAAPVAKPAARHPRQHQPEQPAAVRLPPPAPNPRAAAVPAVPAPPVVPEISPAPEVTPHGEAREQPVSHEPVPIEVVAPPAVRSSGAAQLPLAASAAALRAVSAAPPPARTAATNGGEGVPATGAPREALQARDGVIEEAGAGRSAVAVEAASGPGPGRYDLEAVRHRIDAHKVYPQIAVRNGWEGRVLVEMRLEGDGSLTTVRLLEGSGYAVLDDATLSAVRSASPYPPVARVLTVPVEYRLVP